MKVSLTNTQKKLCVIGDPVLHSRSPLLHNTMLQALGLDYLYLCQPVPRGETARWVECARFLGYAGFNATMPHKEALLPLMDHLDESARSTGSVNTVCIKDGELYGYSTDGPGFLAALAARGISPAGRRVTVLGAGGAARAVLSALLGAGAGPLSVCVRRPEQALALPGLAAGGGAVFGFSPRELERAAAGAQLLVNCTPLGMEGVPGEFEDLGFLRALDPSAAVCDLIYAPVCTPLLRAAGELGLETVNGSGMLICQAVLALELFTGRHIDLPPMLALLRPLVE